MPDASMAHGIHTSVVIKSDHHHQRNSEYVRIAPQAEKWHLLSAMGTSKEGKEPEPHRLPPGVLQRAQLQQRRGVRQQVLRHVISLESQL